MDITLISIDIYFGGTFLVAFPFLLCYFATNITQNLLSVADGAYNNISWYRLPPNQAKYVMLIVGRAQVPAYIRGFKLVYCTLDSFANVKSSCVKTFLVFQSSNELIIFYRFS